jgi:hypothetical protein
LISNSFDPWWWWSIRPKARGLAQHGGSAWQAGCHFEEEIKGRWCKILQIMKLREHLDANSHCQLLKTAAAMATWAPAWQKQVL